MDSGHRVRLNITIDPKLRDRLHRVSEELDKPQARIIEEALTEHLDKIDPKG